MNSWMSIHERVDIHNPSDWQHKSFSGSIGELHNQCSFMASLEMLLSAAAPKVGIIRFSSSIYTDKWHGILSFGIYSTVCAQSLHLSHNSGHSQPVQSIIISGLFAKLEEELKSSHSLPNGLAGFIFHTCVRMHPLLSNSSVAPLTQMFTARSEERLRKVKPDEKRVAFRICSVNWRVGLRCHVDHHEFRPQENSGSED